MKVCMMQQSDPRIQPLFHRTRIFDLLSAYKPVASGGKWRNNVGGPMADKIAFQSKYRFVIAFENSSTSGYLTEKFA